MTHAQGKATLRSSSTAGAQASFSSKALVVLVCAHVFASLVHLGLRQTRTLTSSSCWHYIASAPAVRRGNKVSRITMSGHKSDGSVRSAAGVSSPIPGGSGARMNARPSRSSAAPNPECAPTHKPPVLRSGPLGQRASGWRAIALTAAVDFDRRMKDHAAR